MKNTYVVSRDFNLKELAENLCEFFQNKKLSAQSVQSEKTKWVVQAKEESWKKYISMDKTITVKMSLSGSVLNVEIGSGKWIDKAAGAAVGWFLFWPTLVPTVIGTYQQMQLPKEIDAYIVKYLSNYNFGNSESKFCSNCGCEIKNVSAVFCENCGNNLKM